MDTPESSQSKKKRDPEKNKINQKLYRQRQYAAVNGIEEVESPSPSALLRTHGAYESQRGVLGLQGQKGPGGHATLPCHVGGEAQ